VFSVFGWTPGLRTILRGDVLPCGCLMGEYETRNADILTIVDAHASTCPDPEHHPDAILRRRMHRVRRFDEAAPFVDPLSR
jgi:hypothetical protein